MKTNPQVALMMPVYNGEDTLAPALASVLAQTYPHWTCYIVNDGSTDGTKQLLDKLTDRRFKVIHFKENRGRAFARQKALEAAQGDYLAFLDADDFYHPDKLRRQVQMMETHPAVGLVSCRMASFDRDYQLCSVRPKEKMKTPKTYKARHELRLSKACSMIRLPSAKAFSYDPALIYAEDNDFLSRYLDGKAYLISDDILYYYAEFSSVDAKKIVDTYTDKRKRIAKTWKNYPVWVIFRLLKVAVARLRIQLLLKLKGAHYVLHRRGETPGREVLENFNKLVQSLWEKADQLVKNEGL